MSDPATVLLIATDVHLAECTSVRLTSCGFRVTTALNDDAKAEAEIERHPAIILVDFRCPRLDSMERLKGLLPLDMCSDKVIVVCASNRLAREVAHIGATVCIVKHYRDSGLLACVRSMTDAIEHVRQSRRDKAHALCNQVPRAALFKLSGSPNAR